MLLIAVLLLPLLFCPAAPARIKHRSRGCRHGHHRHRGRGCRRRARRRPRRVRRAGAAGDMVFEGTFGRGLGNYAQSFGNCFYNINPQEESFDIGSSCDPTGDGLYRSDLASSNIYPAGVPECTSIPIAFPDGVAGVPDDTWLMFAEAEDPNNPNSDDQPGWGMYITSYYKGNRSGSLNQYSLSFADYNDRVPAWTSSRTVDTGWHTISICTNDANDGSGVVYGLWLDGVRQKFNHGPQRGSWELHGFPIIQNDPANASNWPLIINDYTGGRPANHLVHGAPLVTRMGFLLVPPEPPGGWNSP